MKYTYWTQTPIKLILMTKYTYWTQTPIKLLLITKYPYWTQTINIRYQVTPYWTPTINEYQLPSTPIGHKQLMNINYQVPLLDINN